MRAVRSTSWPPSASARAAARRARPDHLIGMALGDAHGTAGGIGLVPPALGACFALSSTTLIAFSVVSPDVVAELQLGYGQAGVIAAAYMLGYGLFQIPVSLAGVLFGSGRVLFGATLLMAASSDRKSTRLNSSHLGISYAVFCLKKK